MAFPEHAIKGINYTEIGDDPYTMEDYEKSERMRKLLKKIMLISINATNKKAAIGAIRKEIKESRSEFGWFDKEKIKISNIISDFSERHKLIKDQFFSGAGIKLQRIDSMMAEYVINKMTSWQIPVLCIHDSFIISSSSEFALKVFMVEAYQSIISALIGHEIEYLPKMTSKGISSAFHNALLTVGERKGKPLGWQDQFGDFGFTEHDDEFDMRLNLHLDWSWKDDYYS